MNKNRFALGLIALIILVVVAAVGSIMDMPKLDIKGDRVTVVGCEEERKGLADGTCPKLNCSKAVLDSDHAPTSAELQYTSKKKMRLNAKELRAQYGRFKYQDTDSNIIVKFFLCDMEGNDVASLKVWGTRKEWLNNLANLKKEDQPVELTAEPGSIDFKSN